MKSDQLEQDCQIAEIDAGIAAEMKSAATKAADGGSAAATASSSEQQKQK